MKKLLACLLTMLMVTAVLPVGALAALPEGVPSSLEVPTIQNIELKHNEDGIPYFEAQVYFPQSVLDLDSEAPGGGSVFWDYSVKVDDGSWGEFGGGGYINVYTGGEDGEAPVRAGTFAITFDPIDEGSLTTVDIKSHLYSYQLRVYYDYYEGWPDVQPIYSPVFRPSKQSRPMQITASRSSRNSRIRNIFQPGRWMQQDICRSWVLSKEIPPETLCQRQPRQPKLLPGTVWQPVRQQFL